MKKWRDEEWLREQYIGKRRSGVSMAEDAGCSPATLYKWMDKFGIDRRPLSEWDEDRRSAQRETQLALWSQPEYRERMLDTLSNSWGEEWKAACGRGVARAWKRGCYDTDAFRARLLNGSNNPNWKGGRVKQVCKMCGCNFKVYPSRPPTGKGVFCSKECLAEWQSIHYAGEGGPQWLGGKSFEPYPPTFNVRFKKMIRFRDGNKCAVCRMPGRCVHHINYVKGDTVPGNCITLCRRCHGATNVNREYWERELSALAVIRYKHG